MPPASFNGDSRLSEKPPRRSKLLVQATLPVFFVGLAVSQLFFGSIADHLRQRWQLRSTGQ